MQDVRTEPTVADVSVPGPWGDGHHYCRNLLEKWEARSSLEPLTRKGRSAGGGERASKLNAGHALRLGPVAILILLDTTVAHEVIAKTNEALAGRTIINYSLGSPPDEDKLIY
jgi:hypothetical protein